jgi:hypothetical protein
LLLIGMDLKGLDLEFQRFLNDSLVLKVFAKL